MELGTKSRKRSATGGCQAGGQGAPAYLVSGWFNGRLVLMRCRLIKADLGVAFAYYCQQRSDRDVHDGLPRKVGYFPSNPGRLYLVLGRSTWCELSCVKNHDNMASWPAQRGTTKGRLVWES